VQISYTYNTRHRRISYLFSSENLFRKGFVFSLKSRRPCAVPTPWTRAFFITYYYVHYSARSSPKRMRTHQKPFCYLDSRLLCSSSSASHQNVRKRNQTNFKCFPARALFSCSTGGDTRHSAPTARVHGLSTDYVYTNIWSLFTRCVRIRHIGRTRITFVSHLWTKLYETMKMCYVNYSF
jgi:hypothetical protein